MHDLNWRIDFAPDACWYDTRGIHDNPQTTVFGDILFL